MKKGASDEWGNKITQGSVKMARYLEDVVRNHHFRTLIKKMRRAKERAYPSGSYKNWTPEQIKENDKINRDLGAILEGYESLRKRCKRIMGDKLHKYAEIIAEVYGLDNGLRDLAEAKIYGPADWLHHAELRADVDLCRIEDLCDEELHPMNKGEEIIYLNPSRHERRLAFPVAICLHPKVTKRDILDFVEKRWKHIEASLRHSEENKGLKIRPRKHDQKLLDFVWENRQFPSKEIKKRLDREFPENQLVYFEINKLVQLEARKRYGELNVGR